MAKKATQETFDVFKQKKITAIERAADKLDEKRDVIAGLKAELKTAVMKLKEAIHKNQGDLDRQESPKGEQVFRYVRGDYRVVLTLKEEVAVKIGETSKETDSDPVDLKVDYDDTDKLEVEVPE